MFKIFKNQSGFGLVETLMGGAIVSIAALGLGMSINSMAKSTAKTKAVVDAVSLESLMVGALQDPATYANYRTMLKDGNINQFKESFQMALPDFPSIRIGNGNFISKNKQTCAGFANNKDCLLNVNLQVRMLSASPPSYAFAYQIFTNPDAVQMVGLGVPGQIGADDYRLLVPSSIFREDIGCEQAPGGNAIPFAARGFNFDRGQLTCWNGPTAADQCPSGSYPIGLRVTGDRITFRCQSMTQVSCNNGPSGSLYALNNFKPAALSKSDLSSSALQASASCTFVADPEVPALTGDSKKAKDLKADFPLSGNGGKGGKGQWRYGVQGPDGSPWGTFCPQGYLAKVEECRAVVANTLNPQPSRCPTDYPGNCTTDTNGIVLNGSTRPTGVWFGAPAAWGGALVHPVNVGTVLKGEEGNMAYCRLNNGGQPAGAGWSGYVEMSVNCVVDRTVYPKVNPVTAMQSQSEPRTQ